LYLNLKFILDKETITVGNLAQKIKERIEKNMYPRLLVLTQELSIFPTAEEKDLIGKSYLLHNLNFRDVITGLDKQYDFVITKIEVTKTKPYNFFGSIDEDPVSYYTITDIIENTILGNDPNKNYIDFYFKINSSVKTVNLVYPTFVNNILSDLGSYFSIYSLVAQILSMFYSDYFYRSDLFNAIFKFHDSEVIKKLLDNKKFNDLEVDINDEENEDQLDDKLMKVNNISQNEQAKVNDIITKERRESETINIELKYNEIGIIHYLIFRE
jgi:hypothetical protein